MVEVIMATYKVNFESPEGELGKAAATYEVYVDNEKFGTLKIRKGSIEWIPKWKSKKTQKMNWSKFADLMESRKSKRRLR